MVKTERKEIETRFALSLHDFHFRSLVPCGVAGRWALGLSSPHHITMKIKMDRDDIVEKEAKPN